MTKADKYGLSKEIESKLKEFCELEGTTIESVYSALEAFERGEPLPIKQLGYPAEYISTLILENMIGLWLNVETAKKLFLR